MPFNLVPNVAEFGGASWANYVKTVSNCTAESARRIAMQDSTIGFFFFCRGTLVLPGVAPQGGVFQAGDAVFFTGAPWPGSAPQCDLYQKSAFTVGYVGVNDNALANPGCYLLADGRQLFDVAIAFAANLNMNPPSGYVKLDPAAPGNAPMITANAQTLKALQSGAIQQLQSLGIAVVVSVLGNHDSAGWSNFADDAAGHAAAQGLAKQLANIVAAYGLDGIDIDDEYSQPDLQIPTSLAMVTWYIRQLLPGTLLSKALYDDQQYFSASWTNPSGGRVTLAGNLTYGWEMSYWLSSCGDLQSLLEPYAQAGMQAAALGGGVSTSLTPPPSAAALAACVKAHYGGLMIFDVTNSSTSYLSTVSTALLGQSTSAKPGCLT